MISVNKINWWWEAMELPFYDFFSSGDGNWSSFFLLICFLPLVFLAAQVMKERKAEPRGLMGSWVEEDEKGSVKRHSLPSLPSISQCPPFLLRKLHISPHFLDSLSSLLFSFKSIIPSPSFPLQTFTSSSSFRYLCILSLC